MTSDKPRANSITLFRTQSAAFSLETSAPSALSNMLMAISSSGPPCHPASDLSGADYYGLKRFSCRPVSTTVGLRGYLRGADLFKEHAGAAFPVGGAHDVRPHDPGRMVPTA